MEEKLKKDLQDRTSKKIIFTRIVIKRMYGKAKKNFEKKICTEINDRQKNWFWSKARAYIFPATTLRIHALWPTSTGAGELSGSDP